MRTGRGARERPARGAAAVERTPAPRPARHRGAGKRGLATPARAPPSPARISLPPAAIRPILARVARIRPAHLALLALAGVHAALGVALAPSPLFAKYPVLAARLRAGELTAAQVGDASPLYLLLNLALAPDALRVVQAVAAAATVVVVHVLARRAAGPLAGWVAAAALALAQGWALYGAVLEPDLLIGALAAGAVLCLVAGTTQRAAPAVAAGAQLGLAFALRPTALLLGIAALAWVARDPRTAPARGRLRRVIALGAGFAALALAPGAVLHLRVPHDPRATMSGGAVLFLGHRPEGSGVGATYPTLLKLVELQDVGSAGHLPDQAHELFRTFAAAAEDEAASPAAAERFWAGKVLAFARREPAAFARQLLRTAAFVVASPADDADIPEVQEVLSRSRLPLLPLRALALAGMAGLLLALRRGGPARLLVLWVAAFAASYLVFYYQSRYALAILPAFCALAGVGAARLWEARRAPATLGVRAAIALAPLCLVALPFVRQADRLAARRAAVPVRSEAIALRNAGRLAEARDRLADEQAAFPDAVWPWSPHGYGLDAAAKDAALRAAERARARYGEADPVDAYLLAVLYAQGGRCDLALPLADRAAAAGFRAAVADSALDPDLLAADCLVAGGRRAEAYARVERSLARAPGTLDGLSRAIAAAVADPALAGAARAAREEELRALHDPASADYALARALRRWGAPAEALAHADALAARLPAARPFAEFERAQALLALGRGLEAIGAYARALRIRFVMHGAERFDAPLRQLAAARPADRGLAVVALSHFLRRGDAAEVQALLRLHPELARAGDAAPPRAGREPVPAR